MEVTRIVTRALATHDHVPVYHDESAANAKGAPDV